MQKKKESEISPKNASEIHLEEPPPQQRLFSHGRVPTRRRVALCEVRLRPPVPHRLQHGAQRFGGQGALLRCNRGCDVAGVRRPDEGAAVAVVLAPAGVELVRVQALPRSLGRLEAHDDLLLGHRPEGREVLVDGREVELHAGACVVRHDVHRVDVLGRARVNLRALVVRGEGHVRVPGARQNVVPHVARRHERVEPRAPGHLQLRRPVCRNLLQVLDVRQVVVLRVLLLPGLQRVVLLLQVSPLLRRVRHPLRLHRRKLRAQRLQKRSKVVKLRVARELAVGRQMLEVQVEPVGVRHLHQLRRKLRDARRVLRAAQARPVAAASEGDAETLRARRVHLRHPPRLHHGGGAGGGPSGVEGDGCRTALRRLRHVERLPVPDGTGAGRLRGCTLAARLLRVRRLGEVDEAVGDAGIGGKSGDVGLRLEAAHLALAWDGVVVPLHVVPVLQVAQEIRAAAGDDARRCRKHGTRKDTHLLEFFFFTLPNEVQIL
eukprot:Rhum_TRINITY_DN12485_c1_g1::Rhum_TRINITY_DN12485_c1_g1_i1::g.51567::m.51567